MSNNHFVSKIPHWKLKLFRNNILKISLIPLPIFYCLKNTYFWEISTLFEKNAMVPKEETRVEIGEWVAIWGAESKGAKGYLGQTRDGCIVFQAVLFFVVVSAVPLFGSFLRLPWGNLETQGVLAWCENCCEASKQATMLRCGFHYKQGCRIPLPATLNTLTSSSPPTSVSHLQILQFFSGARSGK